MTTEPVEYFWTLTIQWVPNPGISGTANSRGVLTPHPGATHQDLFNEALDRTRERNNIPGHAEAVPLFWHLAPNRLDA